MNTEDELAGMCIDPSSFALPQQRGLPAFLPVKILVSKTIYIKSHFYLRPIKIIWPCSRGDRAADKISLRSRSLQQSSVWTPTSSGGQVRSLFIQGDLLPQKQGVRFQKLFTVVIKRNQTLILWGLKIEMKGNNTPKGSIKTQYSHWF